MIGFVNPAGPHHHYSTWTTRGTVLERKLLKGLELEDLAGPTTTTPDEYVWALPFFKFHLCDTLQNEYTAEQSVSPFWHALK